MAVPPLAVAGLTTCDFLEPGRGGRPTVDRQSGATSRLMPARLPEGVGGSTSSCIGLERHPMGAAWRRITRRGDRRPLRGFEIGA